MITTLENMIAQAKSLRTKFTTDFLNDSDKEEELSQFLTQLLQKPEVDIEGASQGTVGSCLHQLFIAQQKVSSSPVRHLLANHPLLLKHVLAKQLAIAKEASSGIYFYMC